MSACHRRYIQKNRRVTIDFEDVLQVYLTDPHTGNRQEHVLFCPCVRVIVKINSREVEAFLVIRNDRVKPWRFHIFPFLFFNNTTIVSYKVFNNRLMHSFGENT